MLIGRFSAVALSLLCVIAVKPPAVAQHTPSPIEVLSPLEQKAVGVDLHEDDATEPLYSFRFDSAELDTVMEVYCQWSGRVCLKSSMIDAAVTIKAADLTRRECMEVVEAALALNNIVLVPMGDKFIKVVKATSADLAGHGLVLSIDPGPANAGTDRHVIQVIQLRYIQASAVQPAVKHLMHAYGKIIPLDQSNCLMITDTEDNINRIRDLVDFMDKPAAVIEPRVYEIKFAEAAAIASTLTEIIDTAQQDQNTAGGRTPVGVKRAVASQNGSNNASAFGEGGRLVVSGRVKVIADERSNIVFIFSQKANLEFFDNLIKVLDVEVDPAITFEVVNLEYADAEELSGTLNELVGAATGARTAGSSSSRTSAKTTSRPSPVLASVENLSRLSAETRILAEVRSNSLLLMGQKADISVVREVIRSLDVMLEQVVIETAIFEIGVGDELRHGIDWLYKSADLDPNGTSEKIGAWDGSSLVTNTVDSVVSGAFNYYQNLTGIDSQMLINLSRTDDNARLISTPVIMTTDNTEATLSIGEQRPVVTSTDTYSSSLGGQRSNYEYKDIGIQLTVTPRINPQRLVVMELTQKADQIGTIVTIDNNEVPTILNREFETSIAVPDGGTVVLGGLMSTEMKDTVRKIPILGDIPLIGRYLFSSVTKKEDQRELIVLMTPYVMSNRAEITGQTERLYRGTSIQKDEWGRDNWSESKLRQVSDPNEAVTAEDARR